MLLGVFFLYLSFLAFRHPEAGPADLSFLLGPVAVVRGIFALWLTNARKEATGSHSASLLVVALVDLLAGLFIFFQGIWNILPLNLLFALWFMVDGAQRLHATWAQPEASGALRPVKAILASLSFLAGLSLAAAPFLPSFPQLLAVGICCLSEGAAQILSALPSKKR